MPANAYEMYFPEVFGRSDGGKFTVTIHAATRQQINFRLKTGRFTYYG